MHTRSHEFLDCLDPDCLSLHGYVKTIKLNFPTQSLQLHDSLKQCGKFLPWKQNDQNLRVHYKYLLYEHIHTQFM